MQLHMADILLAISKIQYVYILKQMNPAHG